MLELAPTDDYAHYALGRSLEKLGREQEANGHYKLASLLEARQRAVRRAHQRLRIIAACERSSSASPRRVRVDGDVAGRPAGSPRVFLGAPARGRRGRGGAFADKVAKLRIFENEDGRFDRSPLDVGARCSSSASSP